MSSSPASHPLLREIEGATEGQQGRRDVALDERKAPKHAQERGHTPSEMKRMGELFDAVVKAWGGTDAAANFLGINKSNVSRMQSGEKSVALRHLLALLDDAPEAVLAFVVPLLESIGYAARPVSAPTFTQLASAVLADLDDGSAVTRALIERTAAKRGWSAEQVALALHREGDE